jgi:hypothetical protein
MTIENARELERQYERAELLIAAKNLLDGCAVKLELTPIGIALDVEFLEAVALFASAVHEHLSKQAPATHDTDRPPPLADDTLPPEGAA